MQNGTCVLNCKNCSKLQCTDLEIHIHELCLVVILRTCHRDLGRGQGQLRLTQFNNGTQAETIAALGKFKCRLGLFEQLLGQPQTLMCCSSVKPGHAYITAELVYQIIDTLLCCLSPQFG